MNIQMYKERIRERKWRKTCSSNERKGKGKKWKEDAWEEWLWEKKMRREQKRRRGQSEQRRGEENEWGGAAEEGKWDEGKKRRWGQKSKKENSRESGGSFVFAPWWMTVLTKRAKLEAFSCNSVEILLTRSNFSETYDSAAHNDLGYWFGNRGSGGVFYCERGVRHMVCCNAGLC